MKKITLLLSFIACVVFAQAQPIVTENFNYTVGTGLAANGWVGTGATPSTLNPILVTASSITYTGYPGSGVGSEITLTTSGEDLNKSFSAITTGNIYFSALVNLSAAQATGDYFLHIGDLPAGTIYFGRTYVKLDGTKIAFGILNTSGGTPAPTATYTASNYDLNTTYVIVVKVNAATGASSLIVNPDFTAEPTTGWVTSSVGTSAVPTAGFTTINIRQGSGTAAATLKIDGIRVGTSYSALFPTTGIFTLKAEPLSISLVGKTLTVKEVADGSIVDIYSAIGAKVQSTQLVNGTVQLNSFSKGLYVVRVGNQSSKIML
jgi:hypothetical protein